MNDLIRVAVSGAAGKMGREVVRAVAEADDLSLVAAVDRSNAGEDAGVLAGIGKKGVEIRPDLAEALRNPGADVLVDFTVHDSAVANIRTALAARVAVVVGTTGLTSEDLDRVRSLTDEYDTPALIAPNFAIGAVLMMEFAEQAAAYLPNVEIIELHHEKKLDSPSGTALMTAHKIEAARIGDVSQPVSGLVEKIPGARGAESGGVRIHSIRLPGYVAHQEVIFGGPGQTLTIRHDSTDRKSFMPGVLLAVRRVRKRKGLTVGLEQLLEARH